MASNPEARYMDYGRLAQDFVGLWAHRPRQRTPGWVDEKKKIWGGSELPALRGNNPYTSYADLIGGKAGIDTGRKPPGVACWWGTLFEAVIEDYVAADLGTDVWGTDIHIPTDFCHGNSPDGYCVLWLARESPGGRWRIVTARAPLREGEELVPAIVLLEFKCPYRRRPTGRIVGYYREQVWSGLALSLMAHFGLFVDAVFRRCSLQALGPAPGYDGGYHPDKTPWEGPASAWGMVGVCAPRFPGAAPPPPAAAADPLADFLSRAADAEDPAEVADPVYEAWRIHRSYFGGAMASLSEEEPDPIDFGECARGDFDKVLGLLSSGAYVPVYPRPSRPEDGVPFREQYAEILRGVPRGFYLLGVVPWKLLQVEYVPVERRPGFLEEIRETCEDSMEIVRRIRGAPDPKAEYEVFLREIDRKRRAFIAEHEATKEVEGLSRETVDDFLASVV